MSYEQAIIGRAERNGYEVFRELDGIRPISEHGEAWHRLGGAAEALHDERAADAASYPEGGRWCATDDGMLWIAGRVRTRPRS